MSIGEARRFVTYLTLPWCHIHWMVQVAEVFCLGRYTCIVGWSYQRTPACVFPWNCSAGSCQGTPAQHRLELLYNDISMSHTNHNSVQSRFIPSRYVLYQYHAILFCILYRPTSSGVARYQHYITRHINYNGILWNLGVTWCPDTSRIWPRGVPLLWW